jgi:hypothetical protein
METCNISDQFMQKEMLYILLSAHQLVAIQSSSFNIMVSLNSRLIRLMLQRLSIWELSFIKKKSRIDRHHHISPIRSK